MRNNKDADETLSVSKYLREFDIKDTIDFSKTNTSFKYEPALENKLQYNILNGFRKPTNENGQQEVSEERKELLSKLESPKSSAESVFKRFTITPNGVLLRKGECIGMFEMGSTIALILECPPDYQFSFKEGEKLKMG